MYQLHSEKQQKYFKEVIRLHYEEGYGEYRIARIIPIGHTTAARWITIFAREKGKIKADMTGDRDMRWTSRRLLAIKSRNMADVTEKGLPLQPVSGLLPAYGLQSTTDWVKARTENSSQD